MQGAHSGSVLHLAVRHVAGPPKPLTTGAVAKICRVAPRTVSKWCDGGRLPHYRIPGSRDRRVTPGDLTRFLVANGMPVPADLAGGVRLAVGLPPGEAESLGWAAVDAFGAGLAAGAGQVAAALVGDADGLAAAAAVARVLADRHPGAAVALVVSEDAPADIPGWGGKVYRRPVSLTAVAAELGAG